MDISLIYNQSDQIARENVLPVDMHVLEFYRGMIMEGLRGVCTLKSSSKKNKKS